MTGADLSAFVRDLARETKEHVTESINKATAPLYARIAEQDARITTLEAREWQGIWSADEKYAKGAMVTHGGSVWHSNVDGNRARPALDPTTWTLVVKSGRDAR